jgi:hypothetical protein
MEIVQLMISIRLPKARYAPMNFGNRGFRYDTKKMAMSISDSVKFLMKLA